MSNNNNSEHKNSKRITIFRANNFVQSAQKDQNVAEFMSQSSKSIGPYLQSNTSKIIGSGLNLVEQNILLPYVLHMDADDKDFKKAVYNFFNSLVTKVGLTHGITLEIGLLEDNSKPVSKTNLPIDVEEYIRYRHAKNHPWVAGSRAESDGNQLKYFYIHDSEAQERADNDKLVLQDKAESIWLEIKNHPTKVGMLLTLLGYDIREYLGRNEEQKKQLALKDVITNDAPRFLAVYEADRFELRYWLKAMVTANAVQQLGTSYVIAENKKLIGRSEMEAILFLEDPANDDTVMYLKGATQDVLRKPRSKKRVNA